MQPIELLAILGRGMKKTGEEWFPTRDWEIGNQSGMYEIARLPINDDDPNCLVGGGELNILAGAELCRQHADTLKAVVCAYGGRAPYVVAANGPSESEVMSSSLRWCIPETLRTAIIKWPRDRTADNNRSNTDQEIINIFRLAVEQKYRTVGLVTVAVHYPRSLLMAVRHLAKPEFNHLVLQAYVSEEVLTSVDPVAHGIRVRALHWSQAFMRMMFLEQRGINALLAGTYST